jgi:Domain of unknown function (DUF4345)
MDASKSLSRRALRAVFYGGGALATAAGLDSAVRGARSIPGQGRANPAMESEVRFYGGIYAGYGAAVLCAARRADRDTTAVRALMGTLFLAGLARASGWRGVARPHLLQRALLVIELGLPPLIVAWQAQLSAGA